MNRRGFLGAMLAAATAPAVVKASSLMRWAPTDSGLLVRQPGIAWTAEGLILSIDDFSSRIIKPAMAALAQQIDADMIRGRRAGYTGDSIADWLK